MTKSVGMWTETTGCANCSHVDIHGFVPGDDSEEWPRKTLTCRSCIAGLCVLPDEEEAGSGEFIGSKAQNQLHDEAAKNEHPLVQDPPRKLSKSEMRRYKETRGSA